MSAGLPRRGQKDDLWKYDGRTLSSFGWVGDRIVTLPRLRVDDVTNGAGGHGPATQTPARTPRPRGQLGLQRSQPCGTRQVSRPP